MGTASLEFLGYALLVVIVYNLSRAVAWRQSVLLAASICFIALLTPSAAALIPLALFLAGGYAAVRIVESGHKSALPFLLVTIVAAFVWLKRYAFIPGPLLLTYPYLTLGLSYILFRVLHLIIDTRNDEVPGRTGPVAYLNYTINFTTLVSGPIQRYQDFSRMQLAAEPLPLNLPVMGVALERIIKGFFKANVLATIFSAVQSQFLPAVSPLTPVRERLLAAAVVFCAYPLFLYCNFSGYIDMVIGIARLLRLALPENFDRPFSSDNFINFWSRWHITLSEWLKTYVYYPLLMAILRRNSSRRLEPFWGVFAFFVTFFLVGVWHGQNSVFLFFGFLQGLGVSANKLYQILMTQWLGRRRYNALANHAFYIAVCRGLTFTWFTFTLLWFWSNWRQIGAFEDALGWRLMLLTWAVILAASTVLLALWEAAYTALFSIRWTGEPVLTSRYVRTAWSTALASIALFVNTLLNLPAPDIVYKAF